MSVVVCCQLEVTNADELGDYGNEFGRKLMEGSGDCLGVS